MLSNFSGRITIPVRGTCLIQKVTSLAEPFTEGVVISATSKVCYYKHVPNVGSMLNTW